MKLNCAYLLVFLSFFGMPLSAQKITPILQGTDSDSSFYNIAKINNNEFWFGGEYGILKKSDSLGKISTVNYPNEGLDILKIICAKNHVYLACIKGVIYKYDIAAKTWTKKQFPAFKNKAFYDLIILNDSNLLACGGANTIADGRKGIPHGFIAKISPDLTEIKIVWKCWRKFVWSILETENGISMASAFNGRSSKIIQSSNLKRWKKTKKIHGLIHELSEFNHQIWYCGGKSYHLNGSGMAGIVAKRSKTEYFKKAEFMWRLEFNNYWTMGVTQSGEWVSFVKKEFIHNQIALLTPFCLYDIQRISNLKYLIVGHGKCAYIADCR